MPDAIDDLVGPDDQVGLLLNANMQVDTLQKMVLAAPRDIGVLKSALRFVLAEKSWQDRLDPHRAVRIRYGPHEFERFITTARPDGLGTTKEELRRILGENNEDRQAFEEALAYGPGGAMNPTGRNQHRKEEVITPNRSNDQPAEPTTQEPAPRTPRRSKTGTTVEYAARALARLVEDQREEAEDPAEKTPAEILLGQVKAGELSYNAAMILAGLRDKTISVPVQPEKAARMLLRHFQGDDLTRLVGLLLEATGGEVAG